MSNLQRTNTSASNPSLQKEIAADVARDSDDSCAKNASCQDHSLSLPKQSNASNIRVGAKTAWSLDSTVSGESVVRFALKTAGQVAMLNQAINAGRNRSSTET